MEREDNCKNEIENLKRNPQSPKNVGGNGDPVNLDRLQLAEKLGKSTQRKCEELEEVVARLNEEKRVLTDRVKLAEEKSDRIFTANLKMANEKNHSISELNEKIKELENKIKESERLAEFFREKCMCLDTKIAKMDRELEDLKPRKSESGQVVEELQLAYKAIEELKWEKMESDKKAELLESTLEDRLSDMQLLLSSHKSSRSAAAGNIVDSDDEIKADGVSCFVLQPEAIIEAVKQPVTREAKKRISGKPNETDVGSKRKKSSPEKNAFPATSTTSKSHVERKSEASKEKEDDDAFEPEEQVPLKKRLRSNWNSDLMKKRIAEEKKAGGLGKGKSVPVLKRQANQNVPNSNEPSNSISKEETTRKVVQVLGKMTDAVMELGQVMSEIGKHDLTAKILRRAFGFLFISEESTKTQIATEKKRQEVVFGSKSKVLIDGSK